MQQKGKPGLHPAVCHALQPLLRLTVTTTAATQPRKQPGPSPQREDAVAVAADDAEAADGQRLGTVTLGQDQGAQVAVAAAGIVSIVKLGDACR